MSAGDLKGAIKVGFDILTTSINTKTKKILAQLGSVAGSGSVDSDNAEWWQHIGFASRPSKPVPGKAAAQACIFPRGDFDIVIASQDLRGLELYGQLGFGETCVYAPGEDGTGQARALFKKDGSISLYTTRGNKAGGVGMLIQMDAQNGVIRLINDKGYGLIIDQDGAKLVAGQSACQVLGSGKCSLVGTGQCQVDGSTIVLGSIAVPGVNSVCVGVCGLAAVASTKVLCALA